MNILKNLLDRLSTGNNKEYHAQIIKYSSSLKPFSMSVSGNKECMKNNNLINGKISGNEIIFVQEPLSGENMSLSVIVDGLKIGIIYDSAQIELIISGAVDMICPIYKSDNRFHLYAHIK